MFLDKIVPKARFGPLADCEYFKIDKGHRSKNCEVLLSPGKVETYIIMSDFGTILGAEADIIEFSAGDCIFVPAVKYVRSRPRYRSAA